MINFFQTNILYINVFPSSFGDGFDNLRSIKLIRHIFNQNCLIHASIHPITMECLNWHFGEQKYVDRFFIVNNIDHLLSKLNCLPDNFYDLIVFEHLGHESVYKSLVDIIKQKFQKAKLLFYNEQLAKLYNSDSLRQFFWEKIGDENDFECKIQIDHQIKKILEMSKFDKKVVLFPFSTRSLASFQLEGIKKFCKYFNDQKYTVYIAGETFDPYSGSTFGNSFLSKTIKCFLEGNIDGDVINIMGLNTSNLIKLCNNCDLVVMSPTGINLISFEGYIKTETIVLQFGDTQIMHGISQPYLKRMIKNGERVNWKFLSSDCPFFPCQNKSDEKPTLCRINNSAKCLSDEFNPENILQINKLYQ